MIFSEQRVKSQKSRRHSAKSRRNRPDPFEGLTITEKKTPHKPKPHRLAYAFLLALFIVGTITSYTSLIRPINSVHAVPVSGPSTIASCDRSAYGNDGQCFAFTIDTSFDTSGGHTSTSTTFQIPVSSRVNSANACSGPYNWLIDWGDATTTTPAGPCSDTNTDPNLIHTYAVGATTHQITIRPNGAATSGWMNAFGFFAAATNGNAPANKAMVYTLDTPLTDLMHRALTPAAVAGTSYRFAYMFYGLVNAKEIPDNLFSGIGDPTVDITSVGYTSASSMFNNTRQRDELQQHVRQHV